MKEITLQDGIHFVDLRRLIFARRGKARSVLGLDPLAGRLRAGQPFKARMANVPVSAASARRSWLLPFSGVLSPFFGRIWRFEVAVNRGELLSVVFMAVLAVAFIAALLADVR